MSEIPPGELAERIMDGELDGAAPAKSDPASNAVSTLADLVRRDAAMSEAITLSAQRCVKAMYSPPTAARPSDLLRTFDELRAWNFDDPTITGRLCVCS